MLFIENLILLKGECVFMRCSRVSAPPLPNQGVVTVPQGGVRFFESIRAVLSLVVPRITLIVDRWQFWCWQSTVLGFIAMYGDAAERESLSAYDEQDVRCGLALAGLIDRRTKNADGELENAVTNVVTMLVHDGTRTVGACVWKGLCSGALDREAYVRCMLGHLIDAQPFLADPSGGRFTERLVQEILRVTEKYSSMKVIEALMVALCSFSR